MAMGGHTPVSVYGGSVNRMALHFGGFLLSVIYSGSKKQRFCCRECAEPFYSHTALSRGYRLLFILFVALIVVWIVGESLEIMRGS
jgi:predicted nucleic acid-binding Zn ribbon protein